MISSVRDPIIRRSLASDPWWSVLVFVVADAALLGIMLAPSGHPDAGSLVPGASVLAAVIAIIATYVRKARWRRRLRALPIPLDGESYLRAMGGMATFAQLAVEITFDGSAPTAGELTALVGARTSATVDGATARLVSPRLRTRNRDSRPYGQFHTNAKLDRWFRTLLRRVLVPLHARHRMREVAVAYLGDA